MDIFICDDERVYLEGIQAAIADWAGRKGCGSSLRIHCYSSSEDMLEDWERGTRMDLLMLDIEIPGEMSGMAIAKKIFAADEQLPIIFITNYAEYACEGYEVNALRYLRKPVSQAQIDECMEIVWRRWYLRQSEALMISGPRETLRLPAHTILTLESMGHHVKIRTTDEIGQYEVRAKMEDLTRQLPEKMFIQCHRSYTVNLMYVRRFQTGEINMTDGQIIPIGRTFQKAFVDAFRLYYLGEKA